MAVVGSAQVLIRPSFDGMQRSITRELGAAGEVGGQRGGRSLGSSLAKWGKRGAKTAAVAIGAVASTALVKGFQRLTAIENAEASLRGLGHSAEDVTAIMSNALEAVKGTAFGMDEAAGLAATMVAAGIEPGQDLERVLRLAGDAATIAGTDLNDMGLIWGKVAAKGKVDGQIVNQMLERQIPILDMLGEHYGVTAAEASEMVSAGTIDFENFAAAMETSVGGAALESGNTTTGAFKNMGAALARTGANFLSGIFPMFKDGFSGITEWLGPIEDKAKEVGEALGRWFQRGAEAVKSFIQEFKDGEGAGGRFRSVLEGVRDVLMVAFNFVRNTVIPALQSMAGWLRSNASWLLPIAAGVTAMVAAWKAYQFALVAVNAVQTAWAARTKIMTVAQAALNAVMRANPLGIVVLAITGLVAALITAWNTSETFRKVVTKAWEGIKSAASWAWDALGRIFKWIKDGLGSVGAWFTDRGKDIQRAWTAMKDGLSAGWNWIRDRVFTPVKLGISAVRATVSTQVDRIKTIWNGLKAAFRAVWHWIRDNVFGGFRNGLDRLAGWVETGVGALDTAWRALANLFREPINGVINFVWNDGLKKAFDAVSSAVGSSARLPRAATIPRFARGGRMGRGMKLVGEEGPELIDTGPGYVYTARETKAMLASGQNPMQSAFSASNPPHGGLSSWVGDRWEDVKAGARWVGDKVVDAAGNVLEWVRGGLAKAANAVLSPIFNGIAGVVGGWGKVGGIGADTMVSAKDRLVEWIRGKDEEIPPVSDTGGRSLRGAQPHVNAYAHSLADAVGGIRMMQAFNQSMAGGHPRGLAVDFIDSVSKLNRLADVIVQTNGYSRYNYTAWQARLWSPGRGWRPQGRGYGNDPYHRWHLHAEWYDQGGLLKPGTGVYANATGRPEPVLTASQWDDISTLAARGAGAGSGPAVFELYDADGALIGRMRGEARSVVSDEGRRSTRLVRQGVG